MLRGLCLHASRRASGSSSCSLYTHARAWGIQDLCLADARSPSSVQKGLYRGTERSLWQDGRDGTGKHSRGTVLVKSCCSVLQSVSHLPLMSKCHITAAYVTLPRV